MPKLPGADARQSRTLQSLDRFTPAGIEALACVGLVLLEFLDAGRIEANTLPVDQSLELIDATVSAIELLYPVQDCVHGSSANLPCALAAFLAVAESEESHG